MLENRSILKLSDGRVDLNIAKKSGDRVCGLGVGPGPGLGLGMSMRSSNSSTADSSTVNRWTLQSRMPAPDSRLQTEESDGTEIHAEGREVHCLKS
jgi:hypothetical protein